MNRRFLNVPVSDAGKLLEYLSQRQYLLPHRPVGQILDETVENLGVCPNAVTQAIQWLQIDASRPIGRIGRTELIQLAQALYRRWHQSLSDRASTAQSA